MVSPDYVDAINNLMNPIGGANSTMLRYRKLKKSDDSTLISQWHEDTYRE
jgi:hypothetical protein